LNKNKINLPLHKHVEKAAKREYIKNLIANILKEPSSLRDDRRLASELNAVIYIYWLYTIV
jgi:hypothetical protein